MTGLLALVGGGAWTDGCTFDRELLDASGSDTVAVVPTGSAYENPGRLVEAAAAWFEDLGAKVLPVDLLARPDASDPEVVAQLAAARFIYLAGSSAMHLRSVLKDSPAYDAIVQAHRDGAVLAGANAGADVLCDPMVDSRGGAFTVGLGLVSGLAVIPGSNTWSPEKVHRTVELMPAGVVVAAVPEATALIRSADGAWRTEGVGEVGVYAEGRPARLADLP